MVYPTDPSTIKGRQYSCSLAEDMKAGDILTQSYLCSNRPGYGPHPKYPIECLGKKVNRDLEKGDRFALEMINCKSLKYGVTTNIEFSIIVINYATSLILNSHTIDSFATSLAKKVVNHIKNL